MKRLIQIAVVALALAGTHAWPTVWLEDIEGPTTGNDTNDVINWTDNTSSVLFRATEVTFCNLGATNELFIELDGTVASATTSRQVNAGVCVTFTYPNADGDGMPGMGVIAASGETSTYQAWAIRRVP